MFKNHNNSKNLGFTLIELLVVVAIIGILSSVVIASLNSAREKGKIGAIKSTLKNMQSQAEITYLDTGSYASLYNTTTYDCIGPLANMALSLTDKGVTVKCYSRNSSAQNDVYLRFGATAIIYDANAFKAWSTDQNGVVAWDQKGVNSSGAFVISDITANWADAKNYCALSGGRLPSIEQAITLSHAWYQGSSNTTYTPLGFFESYYWSSTPVPSPSTPVYWQYMPNGSLAYTSQASETYVRCVR